LTRVSSLASTFWYRFLAMFCSAEPNSARSVVDSCDSSTKCCAMVASCARHGTAPAATAARPDDAFVDSVALSASLSSLSSLSLSLSVSVSVSSRTSPHSSESESTTRFFDAASSVVRVRLRLDDTDDSSSPESADSARRSDDRFIVSFV
jgi:hypothetical protein